jgi:hypothetical protein
MMAIHIFEPKNYSASVKVEPLRSASVRSTSRRREFVRLASARSASVRSALKRKTS